MATLKKCDRCAKMGPVNIIETTINVDIAGSEINYELCDGCKRDLQTFLKNMDVTKRSYDVRG